MAFKFRGRDDMPEEPGTKGTEHEDVEGHGIRPRFQNEMPDGPAKGQTEHDEEPDAEGQGFRGNRDDTPDPAGQAAKGEVPHDDEDDAEGHWRIRRT